MFSFFLKPSRILAAALLLIASSLFIPLSSIDKHIISMLYIAYCFIAYFKVKKNSVEFYAEKVSENRALLLVSLVWLLSLLMLETNVKLEWYRNNSVVRYVLIAVGIGYSSVFFWKVFLKK